MCGNWKESDDYDKKKKINFFPKKKTITQLGVIIAVEFFI